MPTEPLKYFELLKTRIVEKMKQTYPGINPDISQWKGQEITDFQEELRLKVSGQISEKWFYNHFRNQSETLPRIDVLNILSRYVGYSNWDDFIYRHSPASLPVKPTPSGNRYFIIVPLFVLLVVAVIYLMFRFFMVREYHFRFVDTHTKERVTTGPIEMKVLYPDQSPVTYISDSGGEIHLKTGESQIKMVVTAPYYKPDTIIRTLKKFDVNQTIGLNADDVSLLIHYFSSNNVKDWMKRRACLDTIIDPDAVIYQVYNGKTLIGAELYNKPEFIDKLTMPSGNLKHIDILETRFRNDKIYLLRFRIRGN